MRNYLSPLAEAREIAPKGFGSFAIAPIPAGTIVATFGGTILNRINFETHPLEQRSRSIQIDADQFVLGPESRESGDSINHSCSPNCRLRNATQLIAMHELSAGEELTYDYATSDASNYDEFECACGSDNCRLRVTGNDWQIPELQIRYQKIFSPYVQRKIKAAQSSRPLTKRDAEELINSFDANPQAALMRALRIATGMPHASWKSLVALTSTDLQHRELLYEGDQSCLDQLVKQLNEQRTI
ncbi:unannotated protein [freshwater metagenome]|uniref:Unannotated protein n=1 Tax=freshwater metagenome TaxID=449393 RepID=A0A6J7L7I2_9ZZZZ